MQLDLAYLRFLLKSLDRIRVKIISVRQSFYQAKTSEKKIYYKDYIIDLKIQFKEIENELFSYAELAWELDKVETTKI